MIDPEIDEHRAGKTRPVCASCVYLITVDSHCVLAHSSDIYDELAQLGFSCELDENESELHSDSTRPSRAMSESMNGFEKSEGNLVRHS